MEQLATETETETTQWFANPPLEAILTSIPRFKDDSVYPYIAQFRTALKEWHESNCTEKLSAVCAPILKSPVYASVDLGENGAVDLRCFFCPNPISVRRISYIANIPDNAFRFDGIKALIIEAIDRHSGTRVSRPDWPKSHMICPFASSCPTLFVCHDHGKLMTLPLSDNKLIKSTVIASAVKLNSPESFEAGNTYLRCVNYGKVESCHGALIPATVGQLDQSVRNEFWFCHGGKDKSILCFQCYKNKKKGDELALPATFPAWMLSDIHELIPENQRSLGKIIFKRMVKITIARALMVHDSNGAYSFADVNEKLARILAAKCFPQFYTMLKPNISGGGDDELARPLWNVVNELRDNGSEVVCAEQYRRVILPHYKPGCNKRRQRVTAFFDELDIGKFVEQNALDGPCGIDEAVEAAGFSNQINIAANTEEPQVLVEDILLGLSVEDDATAQSAPEVMIDKVLDMINGTNANDEAATTAAAPSGRLSNRVLIKSPTADISIPLLGTGSTLINGAILSQPNQAATIPMLPPATDSEATHKVTIRPAGLKHRIEINALTAFTNPIIHEALNAFNMIASQAVEFDKWCQENHPNDATSKRDLMKKFNDHVKKQQASLRNAISLMRAQANATEQRLRDELTGIPNNIDASAAGSSVTGKRTRLTFDSEAKTDDSKGTRPKRTYKKKQKNVTVVDGDDENVNNN